MRPTVLGRVVDYAQNISVLADFNRILLENSMSGYYKYSSELENQFKSNSFIGTLDIDPKMRFLEKKLKFLTPDPPKSLK